MPAGPIDLLTTSTDTRYARWCVNCRFWREGQLERRPGMTRVNDNGGAGLVALTQGPVFVYRHDPAGGTIDAETI